MISLPFVTEEEWDNILYNKEGHPRNLVDRMSKIGVEVEEIETPFGTFALIKHDSLDD
jgi:hypothetical protein